MSVRGAEGAGASGDEESSGSRPPGERRAGGGQRVHFEALVSVGEDAGGGFEAESVDVSPDGMRLRTAYLPEVGDTLVCRFDGPGAEIVAEGEVLWRNEEAKGGEFGLRFIGLDAGAADAVRAMCMTLGDPGPEATGAEEPAVPRGARVRLHIEGLSSPMKARVRDSAARELTVGSNLEFLKVGRSLELEDVDQGSKREVRIDDVKVDVDPTTNVPQLMVTLRFGAAPEKKQEKARASAAPVTRRAAPPPPAERAAAEAKRESVAPRTERAHARDAREEQRQRETAEADEAAERATAGLAARAAGAGRAVAGKVGPALAVAGLRARGAVGNVMDLLQKRRVAQLETRKAAAPRRTTAPPPGGALTSDGRRLVRGDGMDEDEIALPARSNRRAAGIGGALGLLAVLTIFGLARVTGRAHPAAAPLEAQTAVAALPAAPEPPIAAPGTLTANVPLFGATPLSTTEPAAPAPLTSAAPAPAPAPGADGEDAPGPGDGSGGAILKQWGQGTVQHPVVLKIKMDGAIEKISGAAGAMGFTISVPGRRSLSAASELARKDKRLASVNVVNTSRGAEVTVQFKDGVPPYLAKVKGDKLEIALGKEGHAKVAKKKKSKH